MVIGCVGKLVTPVDCKSAALRALLVQLQPHPPEQTTRYLVQRLLVTMGDIGTFKIYASLI